MCVIHEIEQFLWVSTPHGDGQALFLMEYGPHENTVWLVALEKDGALKHYTSEQIRLCRNHTFGIAIPQQTGDEM